MISTPFIRTGKAINTILLPDMHRDRDLQSAATNLLYNEHENDPIFTKRAINMLTQIFHAAKAENRRVLPYVYQMITSALMTLLIGCRRSIRSWRRSFSIERLEHADIDNKFLNSAWSSLDCGDEYAFDKRNRSLFQWVRFYRERYHEGKKPVTVYLGISGTRPFGLGATCKTHLDVSDKRDDRHF